MAKQILILNTSPRKKGNSHLLSAALSQGAEAAGHQVEILDLGASSIQPCLGCDHCRREPGICVQKDGMDKVREAIDRADMVVFSGPLYYYGLPAQMKIVIDRLYAYGAAYPKRSCMLLMTCADQEMKSFAAAELNYQMGLLDYIGWQDVGRLLVPGLHEAGAIAGHPALETAYEMGESALAAG